MLIYANLRENDEVDLFINLFIYLFIYLFTYLFIYFASKEAYPIVRQLYRKSNGQKRASESSKMCEKQNVGSLGTPLLGHLCVLRDFLSKNVYLISFQVTIKIIFIKLKGSHTLDIEVQRPCRQLFSRCHFLVGTILLHIHA